MDFNINVHTVLYAHSSFQLTKNAPVELYEKDNLGPRSKAADQKDGVVSFLFEGRKEGSQEGQKEEQRDGRKEKTKLGRKGKKEKEKENYSCSLSLYIYFLKLKNALWAM